MRRRLLISGKASPIESYLTFKALEDGLSVQLSKNDCEYCVDYSGDWKHLPSGNSTEEIKQGQTLSFRANAKVNYAGIGTFSATKKFELSGRCETIIYGKPMVISLGSYAFQDLFRGSPVVSVSESFLSLPALGQYCYSGMFSDCTSLVSAPALPATTLADSCYYQMFYNCSSLTEAPALPATTLVRYCYFNMFCDCTKLQYVKALFTTEPSNTYTASWLWGVASAGTFVKSKDATWDEVSMNGVPSGWTIEYE